MNEIITVFYSLTGLGLLLWIIMIEYPAFQLEQARERLYGLRRQLFCIGEAHQIFDKRAYAINRSVINGMIRYLDNFSFLRFVVAVTVEDMVNEQNNIRAYKRELERSYKDLPHDITSEIDNIRDEVNDCVIAYLTKTSPVALALIFIFAFLFMTGILLKFMRYGVLAFEAAAERMGERRVYGT